MGKEKRLGRGLEALIGRFASLDDDEGARVEAEIEAAATATGTDPERVDMMLIDRNPYQPRQEFDEAELDSLAESLATHGLLQPLVVRRDGERYQLIAGERRLRAATRIGWTDIPVRIVEADQRGMAEIALVENLQRRDLNALEKAQALANYLATHGGRHEDLAKRLSMERASVSNLLRLLESPDAIKEMVRESKISAGHARALLSLTEAEQLEFAQRIVDEEWNVRTTESAVKERQPQAASSNEWTMIDSDGERKPVTADVAAAVTSAQTQQLEQELRSNLGTKVTLTHKGGKGKIVIPFGSHAEFERIYALLCKTPQAKNRMA
ncbi:MAG: ParB/RepB/Spo0J family partition protein [Thermoguttaceae bacterium]